MGVYVNTIEEIRNRLASAMGVGKKLDSSTEYGLKRVLIGNRALVDGVNIMPCILISDSDLSINETYEHGGYRRLVGDMSVVVILKFPIKDQQAVNRLYDSASSTGFLFFVEKVLDVLNETTGQATDPRIGQNSYKPVGFSVGGIVTSDSFVQCEISFSVQTSAFLINSRS